MIAPPVDGRVETTVLDAPGQIEIVRYGRGSGAVEARFEATLGCRGGNDRSRTLPDTFRVAQGTLTATVTR